MRCRIYKKIYKDKKLSICEIGSGNSKLLYLLEKQGLIGDSVGYEISQSRWLLANKFGELLGSRKVKNINKNFLDEEYMEDSYDLIVMVDLVLQIISPLYDESDSYQYALHKFSLDNEQNVVINKIHFKRDLSSKDTFSNVIKSYSIEEITKLLCEKGFDIEIYSDSDNEGLEIEEYSRTLYIVLARKR